MRRTGSNSRALAVAGALTLMLAAAPSARSQETPQRPYPPPEAYGQPQQQPTAASQTYAQQDFQPFTAEQLDNLVAPIALYADPLLAQVLLAATFPDEISEAAQYVRTNGTDGIDDQAWDVSVKAVAHYPTVLNMMETKTDWTTSLGQAYAAQSTDVMRAVQRLRRMAQTQGNLVSSGEQEVVSTDEYIRIWPANPRYIYVPVYDPAVIYFRPVFVRPGFRTFFSFGVPFPIGAWLIYDWDWPAWRIYYTGWMGGGWIARSRPFVQVTNVYYVNPIHRRVWFGRDVMRRHFDWGRIHRYDAFERGPRYGDRRNDPMRRAVPRTGEPAPSGRRLNPRGQTGSGALPLPRVVPLETQPTREAAARAPIDRRPGIEPSRRAPVERNPGAELPRVVPLNRSPSTQPRRAPVERYPADDLPRVVPLRRSDAPEPPRWTPVERGPAVERPRQVEGRPQMPQVVPMRPTQQPAVERPRVESRPADRPRVESRPVERPRGEGQRAQPSGGERQAQPRAFPREHH